MIGLAGCGSSAPSKAAYVKEANGVCAGFNSKLNNLPMPTGNDAASIVAYLKKGDALAQQETTKLRSLTPPSGAKATVNSIYDAQEAEITDTKQIISRLQTGSGAGAQALLAELKAASGPANQKFDSYGLTTCGSGG